MRNGWNSQRLVYRALQDNDADHTFMHDAIAGDPVGFPLAYPEAFRPQSKTMTAGLIAGLRNKSLSVVICLPPGNPNDEPGQRKQLPPQERIIMIPSQAKSSIEVPIGILTLTAPIPETHQHRKTMLGISIVDAYQGHGYGPEAINWALNWAFKFGGMHRVGISCFGFNDRGQRLYEKLGFVKEGTVRECLWFNRAWHDEIYYGMLESDWEKLRSLK